MYTWWWHHIVETCCNMTETWTKWCLYNNLWSVAFTRVYYVLWHIDSLLSGDCKQRPLLGNACNIHACNNRRTVFSVVHATTVPGQRLGKHILAATDTSWTIEEQCFSCGPCLDVITRTVLAMSLVVEYSLDSNGVSKESEESPLLRAVTKQRLGKTIKDWGLVCAVVIL
jgi:hypothetical protein